MNKMSNTGKIVAWGIVVIVVVALLMIYGGVFSQNQGANTNNAAENASNSNATGNSANNSAGSETLAPISFITPVAGDDWQISTSSVISWTRSASSTGVIELLNAANSKLVGVILPQTGMSQTSYTWNTRDIFASRTSATKTTVQPGNYIIEVAFDASNVPNVTSSPFTISK